MIVLRHRWPGRPRSDDVSVSFRKARKFGRLQSRIHAGENRELAGRRQG